MPVHLLEWRKGALFFVDDNNIAEIQKIAFYLIDKGNKRLGNHE